MFCVVASFPYSDRFRPEYDAPCFFAENDGCARLIIRRIESNIFLSYPNTIDFRTPDLKITMCETTLQSLLRFLRIISRLKLQQPVIFRQHLHLTDGNGVEFCQTL